MFSEKKSEIRSGSLETVIIFAWKSRHDAGAGLKSTVSAESDDAERPTATRQMVVERQILQGRIYTPVAQPAPRLR